VSLRVDRGRTPVLPPSEFGGNLDVRYLTVGTTLFLPVGVDGALLSIGDGHAAQGDGEVCGSAIETGIEIAVRVRVRSDLRIPPRLSSRGQRRRRSAYVTTGVADDLRQAAQDAVRAMIEHLMTARHLGAEEAYGLTSIVGELRINEIVNAPMWVVSMAVPSAVFETS
jgi:acetamidase/formamidase